MSVSIREKTKENVNLMGSLHWVWKIISQSEKNKKEKENKIQTRLD